MFISAEDIKVEGDEKCQNEFISGLDASSVPARDVILVRASFAAGEGHGFHYHEDREEFLYILEGEVEQWIGEEKKICRAGDVIFIEPGVVHASFNVGKSDAKLLAIFGNKSSSAPLAVDVSAAEPWRSLRS
jgi:quercetin dioxygenase-like cupin family protein